MVHVAEEVGEKPEETAVARARRTSTEPTAEAEVWVGGESMSRAPSPPRARRLAPPGPWGKGPHQITFP